MHKTQVLMTASALALAGMVGQGAAQAVSVEAVPPAPNVAAPEAPRKLSPEAEAFRSGVLREVADLSDEDRDAIMGFYQARNFAPYWLAAGGAEGEALVSALSGAPDHGLPIRRYDPGAMALLLESGDEPALIDVAATRAYLRYAGDLASGIVTPVRVDEEINIHPDQPKPADQLVRLREGSVARALREAEPASPEYRRLIAEKARLEEAAKTADWGAEVPQGATMRLGDSEERVASLRARLAARGYRAEPVVGQAADPAAAQAAGGVRDAESVLGEADPARFDLGLEAALKRFQAENGLEDDGLAGANTLAAINEAPTARLSRIVVNLERLRWMNGEYGSRYIVTNIPDYSVKLVENGNAVFRSRVVVGLPKETRTPEFSEDMTYMVVNPTWHIPDSIAQRVYLPKLKRDPNVLANSNMRLFTRSGTEINPGLVDFTQFGQGNFPFRVKQNPSSANALGRVKFMFPNQFAIYLHDTPHRELFARDMRAFSNGCVRVEDPLGLAYALLEGQVEDPEAAFAGWMAARTERTVTLARPIPVHIEYRTVFVDDAGEVQHRFDVYGRDARVFEAMEAEGVTLTAAQG